MQLIATVKRGVIKKDLMLHPHQLARRCRGCGYVNIFMPLQEYEALATL